MPIHTHSHVSWSEIGIRFSGIQTRLCTFGERCTQVEISSGKTVGQMLCSNGIFTQAQWRKSKMLQHRNQELSFYQQYHWDLSLFPWHPDCFKEFHSSPEWVSRGICVQRVRINCLSCFHWWKQLLPAQMHCQICPQDYMCTVFP